MSGNLTNLRRDKVFRRAVVFPARMAPGGKEIGKPRRIILWFRWSTAEARWLTAAAPVHTKRSRLRWRPLKQVLWEAFGLELTSEQQLQLQENAS